MNKSNLMLPLGLAIVGTVFLMATELPTKEFQDIMRSNGSIIDINLGIERASPSEQSADANQPTSLRTHVKAKDYEGIAMDAATLTANFKKVDAFWTERKVEDAITLSRNALKAAEDLQVAAKEKNDAGISKSAGAVLATCRACHQVHRLMQLTDKTFQIM